MLVYDKSIWNILLPFCTHMLCHLVHYSAIWYIIRSFGILFGHLVYYSVIWYIIRSFGIIFGHLVYHSVIWHIFAVFCMLYQEESGSPVSLISSCFT
jgi:hypothetical protein